MGIALNKMDIDERRNLALSLLPGCTEQQGRGVIRASCPFHQEKDPSFDYDCGKDLFHCLGCGHGGDLAALYIQVRGLDPKEGFKQFLKEHCGGLNSGDEFIRPKKPIKVNDSYQPREHDMPPALWQEKAGKLVEWAVGKLNDNPDVLAWLRDERGINPTSTEKFCLGWIPSDTYRPRTSWGLAPVSHGSGKIFIPGGLVIPAYTPEKSLSRIKIRRPYPESGPEWARGTRYWMIKGSSPATWVINPHARVFVLVETELDAILIFQAAGDLVGTIPLGSATNRPDKLAFKILQEASLILNALDFDQAGSKQAWTWWTKNFPSNHERWPVPSGKDPGEAFQAGVDIREWIKAGIPPLLLQALAKPVKNSVQPAQNQQQPVPLQDSKPKSPDEQALERLNQILRSCRTGKLHAVSNGEWIGSEGCVKCYARRPGRKYCDLPDQVGMAVCASDFLTGYILYVCDGIYRPWAH